MNIEPEVMKKLTDLGLILVCYFVFVRTWHFVLSILQTLYHGWNHLIYGDFSEKKESTERVYLVVPYGEKDEAKRLGARWDQEKKQWWIPANMNRNEFKKWLKGD